MKHFLIFGTHPFLSLAEAKAVIGGERPMVSDRMAIFENERWDGGVLQETLGGIVKLGDVVFEGKLTDLTPERLTIIVDEFPRSESGKIEFGLTLFGASGAQQSRLQKLPLQLKRILKERGRSVRWVTGEKGEVTPAAVMKAKLTTEGYDFCIGIFGTQVVIGLSTHVQDADAWSKRDYGRPFRDELTGMLPPKLARMMVNLGHVSRHVARERRARHHASLLDPFCGGGTVLMEAGLLGINKLIGSDIEAAQIEGTRENFEWLQFENIFSGSMPELFVTPVDVIDKKIEKECVDVIVTEGYLGKPLSGQETLKTLNDQKQKIEDIWRGALRAFSHIQKLGGRVVCIWPVWFSSHGTVVVDLREEVGSFGYRWIDPLSGWIDKPVTLTYARPEQRVKRNVIVLERG